MIEGSVRIAKEHLRCMTRAANTPLCFWAYAMKQLLPHARLLGWERRHSAAMDQDAEIQALPGFPVRHP
eukprot:1636352-Rhodomonas_salina.1